MEAVITLLRVADADILVLAGVDFDLAGHGMAQLAARLADYPHHFARAPNRGVPSGLDRDGDGRLGEAEDALGYGAFRGQGGLAVLSRHGFDLGAMRDFSGFAWRDLPGHLAPADVPGDFPLSTTAHWDLPVILPGGGRLNLLIWHATPPVFDGPEDRNGRRNHDEAAFWRHYLDGGLGPAPEHFVLAGVGNLDPVDGARAGAIEALLTDPRLIDPIPASEGAIAAAGQGGANGGQRGDPARDTVDWRDDDGGPGNLRVDYLLPSSSVSVTGAGVLWPAPGAPLAEVVAAASRHRLVWVDLALP